MVAEAPIAARKSGIKQAREARFQDNKTQM